MKKLITTKSRLGRPTKNTSLILWDEAPTANKICFEALYRTLRNILRHKNVNSSERPFVGMTMVIGGDFNQILPVIPKGSGRSWMFPRGG